jgi:predicted RNA-binding Zn-ribbon protein involved in translation (DUF1610 family)
LPAASKKADQMIKCECGENIYLEQKNDEIRCPTCGWLHKTDKDGKVSSVPPLILTEELKFAG